MVMARYREQVFGVFDTLTGRDVVPHTPEWEEYQRHTAETHEEPDPALPAGGMTLEQLRAEKIALVENHAGELRRKFTGRAVSSEMATWPTKVAQARAFMETSNPMDAALLYAEAIARGTTLDALAARVINNATAHYKAEGAIAGAAGKHKDTIAGIATVEELVAHDVEAGWPS